MKSMAGKTWGLSREEEDEYRRKRVRQDYGKGQDTLGTMSTLSVLARQSMRDRLFHGSNGFARRTFRPEAP
jgi:hypothetical protein